MNAADPSDAVVQRLLESDDVDAVLAQFQEEHDIELARVAAAAGTTIATPGYNAATMDNPLRVFANDASSDLPDRARSATARSVSLISPPAEDDADISADHQDNIVAGPPQRKGTTGREHCRSLVAPSFNSPEPEGADDDAESSRSAAQLHSANVSIPSTLLSHAGHSEDGATMKAVVTAPASTTGSSRGRRVMAPSSLGSPPGGNHLPVARRDEHYAGNGPHALQVTSPTRLNVSVRAQLSRQALRRNYADLVASKPPPPPDPSFFSQHDGPSAMLDRMSSLLRDSAAPSDRTNDNKHADHQQRYAPDPFLLHAPFGYQLPQEEDLDTAIDGSPAGSGGRSDVSPSKRRRSDTGGQPHSMGADATVASAMANDDDENVSVMGAMYDGTFQQRSMEVEGEPLTDDDDGPPSAGGRMTRRVIEHQQHVRRGQHTNPHLTATTHGKFRNSLLVVQSPMQRQQQSTAARDAQPALSASNSGSHVLHRRTDTADSTGAHNVDYFEHPDGQLMDVPAASVHGRGGSAPTAAAAAKQRQEEEEKESPTSRRNRRRSDVTNTESDAGRRPLHSHKTYADHKAGSPKSTDDFAAPPPLASQRHTTTGNSSDHTESSYTYSYSYSYSSQSDSGDEETMSTYATEDDGDSTPKSITAPKVPAAASARNLAHCPPASARSKAAAAAASGPQPRSNVPRSTPPHTTPGPQSGPPPNEWLLRTKSALGAREVDTLQRFNDALRRAGQRPPSAPASVSSGQHFNGGFSSESLRQRAQPLRVIRRDPSTANLAPTMRTSTRFQRPPTGGRIIAGGERNRAQQQGGSGGMELRRSQSATVYRDNDGATGRQRFSRPASQQGLHSTTRSVSGPTAAAPVQGTLPKQIVWESHGHAQVNQSSTDRFRVPSAVGTQNAVHGGRFGLSLPPPPTTRPMPVVFRSSSKGTTSDSGPPEAPRVAPVVASEAPVQQGGQPSSRSAATVAIPHSMRSSSLNDLSHQPIPVARVTAEYQGRSASFSSDVQHQPSIQRRFGIQVR